MINVSLIGSGKIAASHAAGVEANPEAVRVTAVVEPQRDAGEAMAKRLGAKHFASLEALLADAAAADAVDAVVVCTPPSVRVNLIERSLDRGWAVLAEKPLAHRLIDSERLGRLAASHPGQPCAAGLCHRFTPAVNRMAELTRAGEIGRLVRIENVFAATIPGMDRHWMSDPEVSGGGSLLDAGTHSVDLMQYLAGPCALAGAITTHAWPGRGDSNASILLKAAGGGETGAGEPVACQIATGWAEPTRFHLRLVGERGSLAYDFEEPEELAVVTGDGGQRIEPVETHEVRFERQLLAFARSVEAGRVVPPLSSFAEALRVMRLMAKIDDAVVDDARVLADASSLKVGHAGKARHSEAV